MFLQVTNESRNTSVAVRVRPACTLGSRLLGLLATPGLAPDDGLWLSPCTSVHTFFMRYPIDVLFLDAEGRVVALQTLSPWRLSGWHPRAAGVLELAAGQAARAQVRLGDRLTLKETA